jgi:hypothetical protein
MIAWFLRLFERCIILSLNPNRPDRSQWKKNGRPGPHDYANDLLINLFPYFGFQLV